MRAFLLTSNLNNAIQIKKNNLDCGLRRNDKQMRRNDKQVS